MTTAQKKFLLICGLGANLAILFYCKYLDFTITNINLLTGSKLMLYHIALPLGISFYTFQQISFLIDSYRGEMGRYPFWDYALFVSFFPQLVAGPIVLHQEMIPQFQDIGRKKPDYGYLFSGIEYLILGLAKKVLLADIFGRISDAGWENVGNLNSIGAIATILAYTLEIYFDFSGYCDMAIGIGKLFHIDIPVNFRSPYKAANIGEFWKNWHITLTRFLTTYLYIPLGGNRGSKWKTYRNILIVFTVSGLWHGANWTFVVWGMLHGIMLVLYRMNKGWVDKLPKLLTQVFTFVCVNVAWCFFRAENLRQPFILVKRVFIGGLNGTAQGLFSQISGKNLFFAAWLFLGTVLCMLAPSSHELAEHKIRRHGYYIGLAMLFFGALIRLSEVSKFIYFNF